MRLCKVFILASKDDNLTPKIFIPIMIGKSLRHIFGLTNVSYRFGISKTTFKQKVNTWLERFWPVFKFI